MGNQNLPDGCHHYYELGEVPWDVQKYWEQRYSIFSKYDDGIWMTDDAWFGITPELVANKIAEHMAQFAPANKTVLIDAFSGAGGNTIAFAATNRWEQVIAIDNEPKVMQCAKHNATLYKAESPILWVLGDVYQNLVDLPELARKSAVIFASPPWGGPGYRTDSVFNLMTMQPYSIKQIYESLSKVTDYVVLYLPRTSDLRQLAALVGDDQKIRVTHYCMYGASKAICAYIGPSEHTEQMSRDEPSSVNGAAENENGSASVGKSTELYIGNLAFTATGEDLKEFFKGFTINSTRFPINPRTGRRFGYAFVDLATPFEAERAIEELSGKEIRERRVLIQLARQQESTGEKGEEVSTRPKKRLKQQ